MPIDDILVVEIVTPVANIENNEVERKSHPADGVDPDAQVLLGRCGVGSGVSGLVLVFGPELVVEEVVAVVAAVLRRVGRRVGVGQPVRAQHFNLKMRFWTLN